MRRGSKRKFGRELQQRKAFIKGLLVALIAHQKIRTTVARAKTLKVEADKLVTLGKRNTLHSRRLAAARVGVASAGELVKVIVPLMATRQGGYTRVLKLGNRASDGSPMALIEFVK